MVYISVLCWYIIADDDVRNPVVANTVSMLMLTEIVFLSTPDYHHWWYYTLQLKLIIVEKYLF